MDGLIFVTGREVDGEFTKGFLRHWDRTRKSGRYKPGMNFFSVHWETKERDISSVRLHVESPTETTDAALNHLKQMVIKELLESDFREVLAASGFPVELGSRVRASKTKRSTTLFKITLPQDIHEHTDEAKIIILHEKVGGIVSRILARYSREIEAEFGALSAQREGEYS